MSEPMTLRQRIEERIGELQHGAFPSPDHRAMALLVIGELHRILTETAADDAEQARLAEIGRLVEAVARGEHLTVYVNNDGSADVGLRFGGDADGPTLLDALRALEAKVK